MGTKSCGVCGNSFQTFRGNTRYCSKACKQTAHRRRVEDEPLTVACSQCGQNFQPIRADAKYCSGSCRQKAYRRREVERKRNWAKGKVGR